MNNVLSSVQMFEAGGNCDKYSKRFLYKNLVGGTATTGTGIKQTQRLIKGSADKPLDAVGTFSAFHNAEKVVEKILQMSPIFKLVKIISLAVLSISVVSESQAEGTKVSCINGLREDGITACEKCGDNCNWKIEDGTLSVFGSGNMYDYKYKEVNGQWRYVNSSDSTPWAGYNIETIDIEGVNNVGKGVFAFMTGVKSVNIKSPVRDILFDAFWDTHSLETVVLSDFVNSIGEGSFNSENLKNIVIPDTVKSINTWNTFGKNLDSLNNLNIVCLGGKKTCENIKQMLKNYGYGNDKRKNLYDNVSVANYQQCNSTNYYWNGAECVREPDVSKRKCCDSCKDMGGWCNRIRYTPAEAAEVLKDDNTNEVTITFKK